MKDTTWSTVIEPTRGEQLRVSRVAVCMGVETQRVSYLTANLATVPTTKKNEWAKMREWAAPADFTGVIAWPAAVARAGATPLGITVDDSGVLLEEVWQTLRAARIAELKAAAQAKAAEVVVLLEELDALQPKTDGPTHNYTSELLGSPAPARPFDYHEAAQMRVAPPKTYSFKDVSGELRGAGVCVDLQAAAEGGEA